MTAPKTAPPTRSHPAPIGRASAEQQTTPPATAIATPTARPPVGSTTTPPTTHRTTPMLVSSAGSTIHPAAATVAPSPRSPAPRPDDPTTPPTNGPPIPKHGTSAGAEATQQANDHATPNAGSPAGSTTTPPTMVAPTPKALASAGSIRQPAAANAPAPPINRAPRLADPTLALLAGVVDDLEATRTAAENRVRQLLRDEDDSDGVNRGFGLTEDHPQVMALIAIRDGIAANERMAILELQRAMRKHPLGPWLKNQRGIGEKQGARLLAAIGDPFWNTLHNRPRTVSELWAYCGLHVLPASQTPTDTHGISAGGATSPVGQATRDIQRSSAGRTQSPASHTGIGTHIAGAGGVSSPVGHTSADTQGTHADRSRTGDTGSHPPTDNQMVSAAGVAAKRRKGQKVNWSTEAKTRAHLIAESCMKQPSGTPYRDIYEWGRKKYADAAHRTPCARCGPAGRPAPVGSPLSAGHQHARALRLVAKDGVLKELWREAKRIHEGGE